MKHVISLLVSLIACHFSLLTSFAAVPMHWTVETSRVQPEVRDVVRGETVALEATLQSDGKPFATDAKPVCIFWQTNGMGSAWWTAPCVATASSPSGPTNVLSATFTPAMDPGASSVIGFLGSSGSIYRAAFQLRFRHGPGAHPNDLPLPTPVIDFARVTVLNPPWSGGGSGGTNTNDVKAIVDAEVGGTNDLKAAIASIPKKTSDLENDRGYITDSQISPGSAPGTASTAMYAWDDDDEVRGWDELVKRHQDHYTPSAYDHTFSNAVVAVARELTPPALPYLRQYDSVLHCWWIGRMVNGVIEWEVE